ncbi:hypothetical protein ABKV19_004485, partial [Rosa sericea]
VPLFIRLLSSLEPLSHHLLKSSRYSSEKIFFSEVFLGFPPFIIGRAMFADVYRLLFSNKRKLSQIDVYKELP